MCNYKSLLPQSCSHYSETERRTRQECAATSSYCLSRAVGTHRQREELDRNVQLQVLIASALQSVPTDGEKNQIGMCSYKSLLTQTYSWDSQTEEKNKIGMCSYKFLLPQSCSHYSQTQRRTRQECAATSSYCLSPAVTTHRQREELDRNVQLQVLIASVLQSVLTDREKNQIGMCSYKSLLPQSCSWYSADREKNQIGMCSYKSLLPQSFSRYPQMERRTRQECAATSPYCLSPAVITQRWRVELDRNVQLQVLINSALQSLLTDGEKNKIGMCSYKFLLPQSCSHYSQTQRRTRQECAATSSYCLSPAVTTHRQREELDRNVQLQVLIASVLQSVLTDREKNQIGMCSYKSLLTQSCSWYSQIQRRTRQECAATSPYCLSPTVGTLRRRVELDRNVQIQVLIDTALSVGTHRW